MSKQLEFSFLSTIVNTSNAISFKYLLFFKFMMFPFLSIFLQIHLASAMVVCRAASSNPTEKVFHRLDTEMNLSSICWVGGAGLEFKENPPER